MTGLFLQMFKMKHRKFLHNSKTYLYSSSLDRKSFLTPDAEFRKLPDFVWPLPSRDDDGLELMLASYNSANGKKQSLIKQPHKFTTEA